MSKAMASIASAVHPHQLEVQEFSSYALVIDARAPAAYDEDHLPQAVNLPVSLLGLASGRVELQGGQDGQTSNSAAAVPHALAAHVRGLASGAAVLVYCDRGGLDAAAWATPLRKLRYQVDVLAGGWHNYRRWVVAGLEVLSRCLVITRLHSPPEGGVTEVLEALHAKGEQVLDLAALLGPQMARGKHLPGEHMPSQSAFESALLAALRGLDSERRVWIGDVGWPFGELSLPPGLRDALGRAPTLGWTVPSAVRAVAWRERLLLQDVAVGRVLDAFATLSEAPSKPLLSRCRGLEREGQAIDALTLLIEEFIDPHCAQRCGPALTHGLRLNALTSAHVAAVADELLARCPGVVH